MEPSRWALQSVAKSPTVLNFVDGFYLRSMSALVPIYKKGRNQKPDLIGTGFLFNAGTFTVLVSAAHVADYAKHSHLYGGFGESMLGLPSRAQLTVAPAGKSRDEDPTDIAFWVLKDSHFMQLGDLRPIDANEICRSSEAPRSYQSDAHFIVHGFPRSRQPRDLKRKSRGYELGLKSELLLLSTCSDADVAQVKLTYSDAIFLGYDKDNVLRDGQRVVGPNLDGVSGSPVWYFREISHLSVTKPRLAGIAISWRRKSPSGVIVTPITYLLAELVRIIEEHDLGANA